MRELAKKIGSLVLALGTLALVLVDAALNHGCASSQPAARLLAEPSRDDLRPPNAQAGVDPSKLTTAPVESPPSLQGVDNTGLGLGDDGCDPSYMYATKAPVIRLGNCHPREQATKTPAKSPVVPSNATQQAR